MARSLISIFLLTAAAYGGILSDTSVRPIIQKTIEMRFENRYDEADSIIDSLRTAYPNDPAPLFLKGSNLHDNMSNREDYREVERMNAILDSAIALALEDSTDPWNDWIIGSSLGYKAIGEAQEGSYLSAYSSARDALAFLKISMTKPQTRADAALGAGGYYFWVSSSIGFLVYLPLVPDNRDEGLDFLRDARDNSIYSRDAALHAMVYVFLEAGMIDSARTARDVVAERYPSSILPFWYDIAITEKDGDLEEYFVAAERLCDLLDTLGTKQSANFVEMHHYAAIAAKNLKNWERVIYHADMILERDLPHWVGEKFSGEIEKTEDIRRMAIEKGKNDR